jgi:hypothetical protein
MPRRDPARVIALAKLSARARAQGESFRAFSVLDSKI